MPTYQDVINIIDRLLHQLEEHEKTSVKVYLDDLCPPELSRLEVHKIMNRLNRNNCSISMIPRDGNGELGNFIVLTDDKSIKVSLSANTEALGKYKQELRDKYINDKPLIDDSYSLLKDGVSFDDVAGALKVRSKICYFAPDSIEVGLCNYMFRQKARKPIDWEEIYEYIEGSTPMSKVKGRKMIYDTMRRINKKLKKEVGVSEDLFEPQNKTIRRNY